MRNNRMVGKILLPAMWLLSSSVLTSCSQAPVIVLPESRVQKVSKGESIVSDFDGYLVSSSALLKLLEKAEQCKGSN